MKMATLQSQVYYPFEVNADLRTSNNQLSTQQHQMCCFQLELVSDNFDANGVGTPTTTGQLGELLKDLKETTYAQGNFLSNGNGAVYTSSSGIYDQMMASTISNNYGSEREIF